MNVKKVVITEGNYQDNNLKILVSFDEFDNPVDLINLNVTHIGEMHEASVEKVLNDIDACILKLDDGQKGFIEIKKLQKEEFIVSHSDKKPVCQADKFYVQISQDKKGSKPFSCNFVKLSDYSSELTFADYYFKNVAGPEVEIISDIQNFADNDSVRFYEDDSISLWNLYGLTSILDKATSKVVYLKSGANLIIEPTEAMTIIDVNSAKNYGKASFYSTNEEALKELVHQLRLRSISGIIIVDLLKVSKEEEKKLIEIIRELSKDDLSLIQVHGFTNLGLLEITRSRLFAPFVLP